MDTALKEHLNQAFDVGPLDLSSVETRVRHRARRRTQLVVGTTGALAVAMCAVLVAVLAGVLVGDGPTRRVRAAATTAASSPPRPGGSSGASRVKTYSSLGELAQASEAVVLVEARNGSAVQEPGGPSFTTPVRVLKDFRSAHDGLKGKTLQVRELGAPGEPGVSFTDGPAALVAGKKYLLYLDRFHLQRSDSTSQWVETGGAGVFGPRRADGRYPHGDPLSVELPDSVTEKDFARSLSESVVPTPRTSAPVTTQPSNATAAQTSVVVAPDAYPAKSGKTCSAKNMQRGVDLVGPAGGVCVGLRDGGSGVVIARQGTVLHAIPRSDCLFSVGPVFGVNGSQVYGDSSVYYGAVPATVATVFLSDSTGKMVHVAKTFELPGMPTIRWYAARFPSPASPLGWGFLDKNGRSVAPTADSAACAGGGGPGI